MYYDPQYAEINLQSPQSDSTPWTLTLYRNIGRGCHLEIKRKENILTNKPENVLKSVSKTFLTRKS